jgi:hypothetical protein
MLPIPQCLALAVIAATIVINKLNSKEKHPFDLDI